MLILLRLDPSTQRWLSLYMERIEITPRSTILAISFIIILMLAYFVNEILLFSLVGLGIGVLIAPALSILHKKLHLPKGLSALLVAVILVLIFGVLLSSIYYLVSDQVEDLSRRAPQIYESWNQWIQSNLQDRPWLRQQMENFQFGNAAKQSALKLFKGFRSGLTGAGLLVYALVIGFYTAIYSENYFKKTIEPFPSKHRAKAASVLKECADVLRGWFKAQALDMLIIGVLTALGLWIAGVQYWAIFGLLTAALGIIPYVGIMLVVVAASIITLASDPSKVLWVILVFGITQQLEGNVILPLVMKGKAELPVVPLLIFMLIMGSFYGILGIFVAPPILALLRILYIRLYLETYLNRVQEDPS